MPRFGVWMMGCWLLASCVTPGRMVENTREVPEITPTRLAGVKSAEEICRENVQRIPAGALLDSSRGCDLYASEAEQRACANRPLVVQVSVGEGGGLARDERERLRETLNNALARTNRFVIPRLDLTSDRIEQDTRLGEYWEQGEIRQVQGEAPPDFRDAILEVTPSFQMGEEVGLRLAIQWTTIERMTGKNGKVLARGVRRNDFNLDPILQVTLPTRCRWGSLGRQCDNYGLLTNTQVHDRIRQDLMDKAGLALGLHLMERVPVTAWVAGLTDATITLDKGRREGLTSPGTVVVFQRLPGRAHVAVAAAEISPGQDGQATGPLCWLQNPQADALREKTVAAGSQAYGLGGLANHLLAVTHP